MEDNIEIEISETNRGNEQIIINKKHKFNFSFQRKDKSKIYRCTEYKTINKCKSLIILNDKKEVLKYESLHNHLEKEIDVSISVAKHKIKEEIKKNSIPMDIKPKHIFNAFSQEMGLICPEYSTIRSQIIRNINKQFPPNIKSFDDIPIESKYYKTKRNENFMIFKNTDLIIFQSPFQAYLFSNYHKNIFADGTFYAAPKFSYQLFITRTYVEEFNMFYTTSISILKNKKQSTYETLFKEIKKKANKFRSNTLITTINFHCDFEQGISNAAKKVFPNINIKYCVWHYKRSLEKQKNILCYHEVKNNNDKKKTYLIMITKGELKELGKKKQKIFSATDEIKILIENYKNKCKWITRHISTKNGCYYTPNNTRGYVNRDARVYDIVGKYCLTEYGWCWRG
ncbi:hypothetical protein H8356DRAFT_1436211 [Neocallimastix lanati (nom. inval.)]|nr:hypothetical protein H8356DRAFT_1436211 [Neocallimastix sp. JGI-2020a]